MKIRDHVIGTLDWSRQPRGADALNPSLAAVCDRELGLMLDEPKQTSDSIHRRLANDQTRYAALDVEVTLAIYAKLAQSKLFS